MIEIKNISSYDEWLNYKSKHIPDTHKYIFQVSATWCKPCVALKPLLLDFLESLKTKNEISQNISFIMLDYDIYNESSEFQQIFSIKKIPHFSFYFQDKSINVETSKFEEIKEQIINFMNDNTNNNNNTNNFILSDDF
jgi:thiol-disulfide isomerase/thioredoxin